MYKAFRTNTEEILKMESSIKSTDIDKLKSLQKDFKQKIRPFILPKDDIINGETLKDTYFPKTASLMTYSYPTLIIIKGKQKYLQHGLQNTKVFPASLILLYGEVPMNF